MCQAGAGPGLAGGLADRQSQLPRKVPLNFPRCLQTLPRSLPPRRPRLRRHRPVLGSPISDVSASTSSGGPDAGPHQLWGCLFWSWPGSFHVCPEDCVGSPVDGPSGGRLLSVSTSLPLASLLSILILPRHLSRCSGWLQSGLWSHTDVGLEPG